MLHLGGAPVLLAELGIEGLKWPKKRKQEGTRAPPVHLSPATGAREICETAKHLPAEDPDSISPLLTGSAGLGSLLPTVWA